MRYYLTLLLFVVSRVSSAQFSDDFSDGDFTNTPAWGGMTANFEVDGLERLHLLAPAIDDTSYLSIPTTNITTTWDFFVRMDFNPSSSNLTRVYLVSDNADLSGSLNGYFVMIGNTTDEISLYRQTGTAITEILDGADGTVNVADVNVRLRVTRDGAGNWNVMRDATGGYSFISEGIVADNTYTTTSYFGVYCKYTSTRSELFYFDDLGDPYIDVMDPMVWSITAPTATQLDIQFNEPVEEITAETVSNYSIDNGIGVPLTATHDLVDASVVHLTLPVALTNGVEYDVTVNNVEDLFGNPIASPTIVQFLYFVGEIPVANDVIITEVMADPTPAVGLPEVEYIEIYNRSTKYFELSNWTLGDNSSAASFPYYVLAPGEYVLVCAVGQGVQFGVPNVVEMTMQSYNNDGDAVVLKDNLGVTLDSVSYDLSWYQDGVKDDGGYSLERKHLNTPCSDFNNWYASADPFGGTPGLQNSVWTDLDDTLAPVVSNFYITGTGSVNVTLFFGEKIDSSLSPVVTIDPGVTSLSWQYLNDYYLEVYVNPLNENTIYNLTLSSVVDCWGNSSGNEIISIGVPVDAMPEDIIINEVMFNPLTNGSDYVEIYNRSQKIIDLGDLYLANWDDDSIANYELLTADQRLIMPGEYVLLTEDSTDIQHDFSVYGIGTFQDMDLPSYNDDSGTVYLLNANFEIIDYFHYDEDMHFQLITDENGKALERITFEGGMNNPDNWHTAAENVEWGTPGYENSQLMYPEITGTITVAPEIFSPDNDGYNDILTINLEFETNDNVVNVEIYDNRGRRIKEIKDNFFVGNSALITWDGSTDEGTKASIGTYVILVTVMASDGSRSEYKIACVVGGNL